MRLSKAQLDGACNDKRYSDDFFIDLIFEECSAGMASKHLLSSPGKDDRDTGNVKFADESVVASDIVQNEAAARRMMGTISGSENNEGGITVTASAYDSMLHRDSRFWDVISERRKKIASGSQRIDSGEMENKIDENIPFYGPTIGRRREFANEAKSDQVSTDNSHQSNEVASHHSMQSFSIGGELDFTVEETSKQTMISKSEENTPPKVHKKDDLMEALMAIDDDADADRLEESQSGHDETDTEEIIFDTDMKADDDEDIIINEKPVATEIIQNSNQIENNAVENSNSKHSSCENSVVKVDELEEDELEVDVIDSDQFDFDDDDDDELQDLENFLTKATK